jgi:hypothetical protein
LSLVEKPPPEDKGMEKDNDTKDNDAVNAESVDYYDQNFYNMFFKNKRIFADLDDLTQKVAEYEKNYDMMVPIKHSVPDRSFREYICNSHNDCPFFCRFGRTDRGGNNVRAKRCNLQHLGTVKSKLSVDGKRKRKHRIKGILSETLEQVTMVKNDE